MTDRKLVKYKKLSGSRVIAFVVVAFALYTLVKTFVCGRVCKGCLCNGDDGLNKCSDQEKTAELD